MLERLGDRLGQWTAEAICRFAGFVIYVDRNGERRARQPGRHGLACRAWMGQEACDCGFKGSDVE